MFSREYYNRYLDDHFDRQYYGARLKLKKFDTDEYQSIFSSHLQFNSSTYEQPASMESNLSEQTVCIDVQNLSFHYNSFNPILKNITLSVPQGKIYALLGASGCGKTTLLRIILGQLKPLTGSVHVFGVQPGSPESNIPGTGVGYMPQDLALFKLLTIEETLSYYGHLYGIPNHVIKERVKSYIQLLNLPNKNRLVNQLSGGQQRRVSLAVTLIHQPPLLILDEPTVGVDSLLRLRIWNYLEQLCKESGTTVIITTHYTEEARNSYKVGFIDSGVMLAEDNPQRLLYKYNCISLEEVFLELCLEKARQDDEAAAVAASSSGNLTLSQIDVSNNNNQHSNQESIKDSKKQQQCQTILEEIEDELNEFNTKNSEKSDPNNNGHTKKDSGAPIITITPESPEPKPESSEPNLLQQKRQQFSDDFVVNNKQEEEEARRCQTSNPMVQIHHHHHKSSVVSLNNESNQNVTSCSILAKNPFLNIRRLRALLMKNYILFKRSPASLFLMNVIPLLQITLFCVTFARNPDHIPVAVVNHENKSISLSNLFIDKIDPKALDLHYYNSVDDAIDSIKDIKTWTVLEFPANFSRYFRRRFIKPELVDEKITNNSQIKIYPDTSHAIFYLYIYENLLSAFERFIKAVGESMGYNPSFFGSPIVMEDPIYGSMNLQYFEYITPGMLIAIIHGMSMLIGSFSVVRERFDGHLERGFVAGIKSTEIFISYLMFFIFPIVTQVFLCIILTFFIFESKAIGSLWEVTLMSFMAGVQGVIFGITLSIVCPSELASLMLVFCIEMPLIFTSGVLWPMESMSPIAKSILMWNPLALPIRSLQLILFRGWNFMYFEVFLGVLSNLAITSIVLIFGLIFFEIFK